MTTLTDALRELAEARKQMIIAKEWTAEHLKRVKAMTAYQELATAQDSERNLKLAIEDAESTVRELALAEHALSGNVRPAEGVQVKLFGKVVYEPQDVWSWCIVNAHKYLQLDVKAFEKAAPVLRDLGAPVELTKEARVQIATDLSVWLQEPLLASEEINLLREEQDLAEKEG